MSGVPPWSKSVGGRADVPRSIGKLASIAPTSGLLSSNVAFIVYSFYDGLYPILILHSVLLPLNVARTVQMLRLRRLVQKAAKGDFSSEWLRPFMKTATWKAGDIIFKRGDYADCIYLLVSGKVHLEEIDHVLVAGASSAKSGCSRRRMNTPSQPGQFPMPNCSGSRRANLLRCAIKSGIGIPLPKAVDQPFAS